MSTLQLIPQFQQLIIKLMIKYKYFCDKASNYLQRNFFEDKYLGWFFDKIQSYYVKYNKNPSIDYIYDQLNLIVEDQREVYLDILKKIISAHELDTEYVVDELEKFTKTSEFRLLHHKAADYYNGGDYEQAFDYTRKQMQKIDEISFKAKNHVSREDMDKILDNVHNKVYEEVDILGIELPAYNGEETWNGKIPKKTVTTVIGAANTGKTSFLINCAYHAAMSGHKVLFVFHEGIIEHILLKFLSRITEIPYNSIKYNMLDSNEKIKIEKAKDFLDKHIRIKELAKVGIVVEDLITYSKETKKEWDYDMLVSDYAGKLKIKNGYKVLRQDLIDVWNSLDFLAMEANIAVLTAVQVNKTGQRTNKTGGTILRGEDATESSGPSYVSTTVLTLNRSTKDRLDNRMVICLDKTRDNLDGLLIEATTSFRSMITHDKKYGLNILGYDIKIDTE